MFQEEGELEAERCTVPHGEPEVSDGPYQGSPMRRRISE